MHFDVFRGDNFSLSQLSLAMVDLPHVPGRLGQLGWFEEQGIATTSLSIEKVGLTLKLVQTSQRGGPGNKVASNEKRTLRNISVSHLQQDGAVIADEVQNLRAFGSETEVETAQNLVNQKLAQMKRDLDVTHEWHRIGAIKGQVLDADGTTVLADLYDLFGVSQQTADFALDVETTKVKQKITELQRQIAGQLGGIPFTGLHVLCSAQFFDTLVNHPAVVTAYDRWQDGQFMRTQQRNVNGGGGFEFAGAYFEEYRGQVGSTKFIADNKAHAIPTGVPGLFKSYFGPADYNETVNTIGLPYYARMQEMQSGKGFEIESQSNPLHMCTRPSAIVELSI